MKMMRLTRTVDHPNRFELQVGEICKTKLPRHLSVEAAGAKLTIPAVFGAVADHVIAGSELATPLALKLFRHLFQSFSPIVLLRPVAKSASTLID